jgi:hypothetical protein
VRSNLWHKVTSDPGTHAFVEPTATPAAPTVSGDGDEAVVREIANRHVSAGNCCFTNTMVLVREALQHGRELGAREEREHCVRLARHFKDEPGIRFPPIDRQVLIADAIARRSGGQGK